MSSEKVNPNSSYEIILENIKKYGPVSATAIADALQITPLRVRQAVSYMRTKKNINVIKQGPRIKLEYYYDPQFPLLNPYLTKEEEKNWEQSFKADQEIEETEKLFGSLIKGITENKKPSTNYLDNLTDRCYHLILALENCSNTAIMDNFNLVEEEARILINKVMIKYPNLHLSFTVHISKRDIK